MITGIVLGVALAMYTGAIIDMEDVVIDHEK